MRSQLKFTAREVKKKLEIRILNIRINEMRTNVFSKKSYRLYCPPGHNNSQF